MSVLDFLWAREAGERRHETVYRRQHMRQKTETEQNRRQERIRQNSAAQGPKNEKLRSRGGSNHRCSLLSPAFTPVFCLRLLTPAFCLLSGLLSPVSSLCILSLTTVSVLSSTRRRHSLAIVGSCMFDVPS